MVTEDLAGNWGTDLTEIGLDGRVIVISTDITLKYQGNDQVSGESDVDNNGHALQVVLSENYGAVEAHWALTRGGTNGNLLLHGRGYLVFGEDGDHLGGGWSAVELENGLPQKVKIGTWVLTRAAAA